MKKILFFAICFAISFAVSLTYGREIVRAQADLSAWLCNQVECR
jgi:hypothetical protein